MLFGQQAAYLFREGGYTGSLKRMQGITSSVGATTCARGSFVVNETRMAAVRKQRRTASQWYVVISMDSHDG